MTFGHSKLARQQKCIYLLGLLTAPNRPFLLHPLRASHRPRWEPLVYMIAQLHAHYNKHWLSVKFSLWGHWQYSQLKQPRGPS